MTMEMPSKSFSVPPAWQEALPLRLEALEVQAGLFHLGPVELHLQAGQVGVLVGPSGSGKTMLLESVAGFHSVAGGEIWLGNQRLSAQPVETRKIGYVFQDFALFPHLSVRENILFSAPYRGGRAVYERLSSVAALLGIESLLERQPSSLSGGEKQRVALARALVTRPRLFLFDEPMSALDAALQRPLRRELRKLLRSIGVTTLYVTHNFAEAQALGDVVGVLRQGRLEQFGTLTELFEYPKTPWVARFVGMENMWEGQVEDRSANGVWVWCKALGTRLFVATEPDAWPNGLPVVMGIRSEELRLVSPQRLPYAENLDDEVDFATDRALFLEKRNLVPVQVAELLREEALWRVSLRVPEASGELIWQTTIRPSADRAFCWLSPQQLRLWTREEK
ncbi:MAG: ABC transporter ATP-binding protein [Firmicutes bacterium]|nr:ABC transporter ATP-binding protein [Bacillota bacterium]